LLLLLVKTAKVNQLSLKAIVNGFEYEGDIKLGAQCTVGYFAQNQVFRW
jgi:hypothetical protein